jgi:hypothetical protein
MVSPAISLGKALYEENRAKYADLYRAERADFVRNPPTLFVCFLANHVVFYDKPV